MPNFAAGVAPSIASESASVVLIACRGVYFRSSAAKSAAVLDNPRGPRLDVTQSARETTPRLARAS